MLTHTIGDYSERKEDKVSEKKILLGNEAIARGAYEAGVKVSAAYPGTPSTEVSEALVQYDEIYAEWAPNEKVATEVAIGASIAGVRSMCVMKHVGMNVAAERTGQPYGCKGCHGSGGGALRQCGSKRLHEICL